MVLSFGEVLVDCFPDQKVIGGAPFNVVVHLKRLGINSDIISKIGEDENGNVILDFLKREGLGKSIQIDKQFPTGYVTVTLKNGQPSYTIHENTGWEHIDFKKVNPPKYLVFGSLALSFPNNKVAFEKYVNEFNGKTTFVCDINLRAPFYNRETIETCLRAADILKINDEEMAYLESEFNIENAIDWLRDNYKINKVLLTKGADGAELFWENDHFSIPVYPVKNIVDTVGAGDSFTALFLYGVMKKLPFDEVLAMASKFASAICETKGAIPKDLSLYDN